MSSPTEIPGWRHVYSGKVRDLYAPTSGDPDRMLVVASDRVSAFDHVLAPGIPTKGELLTTLSQWWFDQLAGADGGTPVANHLTGEDAPSEVAGRAMVARKLTMIPIECVVRGYLTGSGFKEYVASGTVCGVALPACTMFSIWVSISWACWPRRMAPAMRALPFTVCSTRCSIWAWLKSAGLCCQVRSASPICGSRSATSWGLTTSSTVSAPVTASAAVPASSPGSSAAGTSVDRVAPSWGDAA